MYTYAHMYTHTHTHTHTRIHTIRDLLLHLLVPRLNPNCLRPPARPALFLCTWHVPVERGDLTGR